VTFQLSFFLIYESIESFTRDDDKRFRMHRPTTTCFFCGGVFRE
jgi:hypothetical protein